MTELGKELGHIIVPLVTPFDRATGDIDQDAVRTIVEHLIENHLCDTILVAGTTGEFNVLSLEERVELFEHVKTAAAGRVRLLAGTGAASTRETIALTEKAEGIGYDAAMVVAPYYCKPTQKGIYLHFKSVAECTSLPIMLYNIPIFTGVNIDPGTVSRLAEIDNILGIKDEAGLNPTQMTEYALSTPENFTVYNGDDIMVLCGMVQGAAGVVSGGSHLIGSSMRRMIDLFLDGKWEEALSIHRDLDPFFKALVPPGGVNPIPGLKAAMEIAGLPAGPPRLPLAECSQEHKDLIREHLTRLEILA